MYKIPGGGRVYQVCLGRISSLEEGKVISRLWGRMKRGKIIKSDFFQNLIYHFVQVFDTNTGRDEIVMDVEVIFQAELLSMYFPIVFRSWKPVDKIFRMLSPWWCVWLMIFSPWPDPGSRKCLDPQHWIIIMCVNLPQSRQGWGSGPGVFLTFEHSVNLAMLKSFNSPSANNTLMMVYG